MISKQMRLIIRLSHKKDIKPDAQVLWAPAFPGYRKECTFWPARKISKILD